MSRRPTSRGITVHAAPPRPPSGLVDLGRARTDWARTARRGLWFDRVTVAFIVIVTFTSLQLIDQGRRGFAFVLLTVGTTWLMDASTTQSRRASDWGRVYEMTVRVVPAKDKGALVTVWSRPAVSWWWRATPVFNRSRLYTNLVLNAIPGATQGT